MERTEKERKYYFTSVFENSSELFLNRIRYHAKVAQSVGGGEELAVLCVYHSAPEPGQTQVLHAQKTKQEIVLILSSQ